MRLSNKVALITGATGGMGKAEARLFAKEGAAVVIAARNEELGNELAKEIKDAGGKALFIKLDVTDQQQWTDAVDQVREKFGALHILVNNAGSNAMTLIPRIDWEIWDKVHTTNVTATVMGIQACAPLMRESGGGSIINIGSIAGMTGNFSAAYSSSKWALRGVTGSTAYSLAGWGIRCNTIQPGFIESNMTKPMTAMPMFGKMMKNTVLLGRIGKAEELASAALFLASDESSYITGTDIVVDGGFSTPGPYLTNERQNNMLEMIMKSMGLDATSEQTPEES